MTGSAPHGRWIVGVDIGGTNIVVGVIPFAGGPPKAVVTLPTDAGKGGEAVVQRVLESVERVIADTLSAHGGTRADVAGVGIGSPGPIDRNAGVVLTSPNLGWKNFPLREMVGRAVGLPVTLDNDANCATYGEWWLGAGRGVQHLVGITIGTGIGGGIVLNGEIVHGASDAAGEIGHTTIEFTGRRCKCGNYGCLEAYCSGPNIAARAREGLEAGYESILTEMVEGQLERITAATVYEAALRDDRYANEVMNETAKILGAGVANVINFMNPQAIVIAGGVTRAGEKLFAPLRAEVRRRAFRSAYDACKILPAVLPDTAGMIGAAGVFKKTTFGSV